MTFSYLRINLLFVLIICATLLKSQNWISARTIKGNSNDFGTLVQNDKSGNTIISGIITSSILVTGNDTFYYSSPTGCLLSKLDSTGNFIWTKIIGDSDQDRITSIVTDSLGNIYTTGFFVGQPLIIDSDTLFSKGSYDFFVTKYLSNGTAVWSKNFGGQDGDASGSISIDRSGAIYVSAYLESYLTVLGLDTINSNGNGIGLILKLDNSGGVVWTRTITTTDICAIKCDSHNNVYFAGTFTGTMNVGGTTIISAPISCLNCDKFFLAKYDENGNGLWAETTIEKSSKCVDICLNNNDEIYITGYSYFGAISFDSIVVTNYQKPYIFLAKYDKNGKALWAKASKGNYNYVSALSCSGNYLYLLGSGDFPVAFNSFSVTQLPGYGYFVYKFDGSGNSICATDILADNWVSDISADDYDHVYAIGSFKSDSLVLSTQTFVPRSGVRDIFLGKLSCEAKSPIFSGIDDVKSLYTYKLFPNPNKGHFNFQLERTNSLGVFTIFNSVGQIITEYKITKPESQISNNSLVPGIYYFTYSELGVVDLKGKFVIE